MKALRYSWLPAFLLLCTCGTKPGLNEAEWRLALEKWREDRVERLVSKQGWLNLAGLFWLEPGMNTMGSDPVNMHVFPGKAPATLGHFLLENGRVTYVPSPGTEVYISPSGKEQAHEVLPDAVTGPVSIRTDRDGKPTVLQTGTLAWFIIQRGDRYGIRLRDYAHPALAAFRGIDYYPPDPDWRIPAHYEPLEKPLVILQGNVIGTVDTLRIPGLLRFRVDGKEFRLHPTPAGDRLFIVFADQTSGTETYGAGRFLYVDRPDPDGNTLIDFNRAYNPPCAFSNFATCPLPPAENRLDLRVEAGEKFSGH